MEENKITEDKIKKFKGDKTPSQRLRAVLYRIWEKNSKEKTFDEYYKDIMEKLIEIYKKRI